MSAALTLLAMVGGLLLALALVDLLASAIRRYAWGQVRRAVEAVTGPLEEDPDSHRALARPVLNGHTAWVAACECGWTGDVYGTGEHGVAARSIAMLEAERHVQGRTAP